ncbi:unnamed protein product [Meganyctiphanes norvegica]|uniref:Uncharacterized protein n=1 Tax=Meganyctiphanes norvegica TaxID=48144 RepID=A0AAV2QGA5_MEGNR
MLKDISVPKPYSGSVMARRHSLQHRVGPVERPVSIMFNCQMSKGEWIQKRLSPTFVSYRKPGKEIEELKGTLNQMTNSNTIKQQVLRGDKCILCEQISHALIECPLLLDLERSTQCQSISKNWAQANHWSEKDNEWKSWDDIPVSLYEDNDDYQNRMKEEMEWNEMDSHVREILVVNETQYQTAWGSQDSNFCRSEFQEAGFHSEELEEVKKKKKREVVNKKISSRNKILRGKLEENCIMNTSCLSVINVNVNENKHQNYRKEEAREQLIVPTVVHGDLYRTNQEENYGIVERIVTDKKTSVIEGYLKSDPDKRSFNQTEKYLFVGWNVCFKNKQGGQSLYFHLVNYGICFVMKCDELLLGEAWRKPGVSGGIPGDFLMKCWTDSGGNSELWYCYGGCQERSNFTQLRLVFPQWNSIDNKVLPLTSPLGWWLTTNWHIQPIPDAWERGCLCNCMQPQGGGFTVNQ